MEKKGCEGVFKFIKGLALFIPTVISGIVLVLLIIDTREQITDVQDIELKLNTGLYIIGIAISVWVGLNIYNLIEKKQVEELDKLTQELNEKINQISPKINNFDNRMDEEEKRRDFIIAYQKWLIEFEEYRILVICHVNYCDMQELRGKLSIKVYKNVNSFIMEFSELAKYNKQLEKPYSLDYCLQLKTMIFAVRIMATYMQDLIGTTDNDTNIVLCKANIEDKIINIINKINQLLEDETEGIKRQIMCYDYEAVINILTGLKKVLNDNEIEKATGKIEESISKLEELTKQERDR